MADDKAINIAREIRQMLAKKRISMREAFLRLDKKKAGLISFTAFSTGLDSILSLSQAVKEKLFARMDVLNIGLVSYDNFLEVLRQTTATQKRDTVIDSFAWEERILSQI